MEATIFQKGENLEIWITHPKVVLKYEKVATQNGQEYWPEEISQSAHPHLCVCRVESGNFRDTTAPRGGVVLIKYIRKVILFKTESITDIQCNETQVRGACVLHAPSVSIEVTETWNALSGMDLLLTRSYWTKNPQTPTSSTSDIYKKRKVHIYDMVYHKV